MDFTLTQEQQMLHDTAARLVRDRYGFEDRQKLLDSELGYSRALWRQYAELGLLGVPFAEASGGLGGGGIELMLVAQAFGRGLVLEPFLASAVLAGGLIERAGTPAQRAPILERIIDGALVVAFAHDEPGSRYALHHVETTAQANGEGYRLDGHKTVVLHGDSAELLVVSARTDDDDDDADGISLFLVDPEAPGVRRRGYATIDGLRAADVHFDAVDLPTSALLGTAGTAAAAIETVVGRGIVALCGEAVGAMERACDLTLDYLKQRKQFGVPIGKFQALQHRMVDLRIELEQARSIAILAADGLDAEPLQRRRALSAAKALIGGVGRRIAEESIQLHGGIGMTWEYSLPHYAKRLVMIDHQLGDVDTHLARFGALLDAA